MRHSLQTATGVARTWTMLHQLFVQGCVAPHARVHACMPMVLPGLLPQWPPPGSAALASTVTGTRLMCPPGHLRVCNPLVCAADSLYGLLTAVHISLCSCTLCTVTACGRRRVTRFGVCALCKRGCFVCSVFTAQPETCGRASPGASVIFRSFSVPLLPPRVLSFLTCNNVLVERTAVRQHT
jgi:hypothetical protein